MSQFVLVPGAWHGAWCWQRVLPLLRATGHGAHAVTLTGVGDRAHLLDDRIRLQTHIDDVLAVVACEELTDVVLVGHSYAGMVITGAADALLRSSPTPLTHLVYVDAVTPYPGRAGPASTRRRSSRPACRRRARPEASRCRRQTPASSAWRAPIARG